MRVIEEAKTSVPAPALASRRELTGEGVARRQIYFTLIVAVAVLVRLAVAVVPGDAIFPAWSGGGDTPHYLTLAENLQASRGFSYAGQPTSFRPPLYPLLLAGAMSLAGAHYLFFVRLLQFGLGLATAALAARAARCLFGPQVYRAAWLLLLLSPMLIYATSMILTEALEMFFFALVFYWFVRDLHTAESKPFRRSMAISGCCLGLATLTRWPAPALLPAGAFLCWRRRDWKAASLLLAAWLVVILPWIVRNERVFGTVTLSTFGGFNLVKGILEPQGRALPGGDTKIASVLGWTQQEYETNERSRPFPSEIAMDQQARHAWSQLIRDHRSELPALTLHKLRWFWLSLDQIENTAELGKRRAQARAVFVLVWWSFLGLAVVGLYRLWSLGRHQAFTLLLLWFLLATLAHLPFCMNTRLRSSFVDAQVVLLAAGGLERMKFRIPAPGG